ncbi:hypothetical protein FHU36_008462 [Nonomuraea muscovyensis]|uniref:Uncharacterized protein n=1 Tax=Nonomuraea muscovyensis TaxID=1124761 RepID=A0A7X0CBD3_9ACTN|nr:hypothetical protein [Nonomuraea muscovyensis]
MVRADHTSSCWLVLLAPERAPASRLGAALRRRGAPPDVLTGGVTDAADRGWPASAPRPPVLPTRARSPTRGPTRGSDAGPRCARPKAIVPRPPTSHATLTRVRDDVELPRACSRPRHPTPHVGLRHVRLRHVRLRHVRLPEPASRPRRHPLGSRLALLASRSLTRLGTLSGSGRSLVWHPLASASVSRLAPRLRIDLRSGIPRPRPSPAWRRGSASISGRAFLVRVRHPPGAQAPHRSQVRHSSSASVSRLAPRLCTDLTSGIPRLSFRTWNPPASGIHLLTRLRPRRSRITNYTAHP